MKRYFFTIMDINEMNTKMDMHTLSNGRLKSMSDAYFFSLFINEFLSCIFPAPYPSIHMKIPTSSPSTWTCHENVTTSIINLSLCQYIYIYPVRYSFERCLLITGSQIFSFEHFEFLYSKITNKWRLTLASYFTPDIPDKFMRRPWFLFFRFFWYECFFVLKIKCAVHLFIWIFTQRLYKMDWSNNCNFDFDYLDRQSGPVKSLDLAMQLELPTCTCTEL